MVKIEDVLTCEVNALSDQELQEIIPLVSIVEGKCRAIRKESDQRKYKGLPDKEETGD
jgi:hypothetical protein